MLFKEREGGDGEVYKGCKRNEKRKRGKRGVECYSIFCDFHKQTLFSRSGIFYETNSKKSANLAACAAKFSLSKKHRDLKN